LVDGAPVFVATSAEEEKPAACPLCRADFTTSWDRAWKVCCGGAICQSCESRRVRRRDQTQRVALASGGTNNCPLCLTSAPSDPVALFHKLQQIASQTHILSPADKHVRKSNFDKDRKRTFSGDIDNAWAQLSLGDCFVHGQGVDRCYESAYVWYDRAAAQGHPGAAFRMGVLFENGWGVKKSRPRAISWFQKAHGQGHGEAGIHLRRLRRLRKSGKK
jgi:TPR repeat protein